ncbi:MAG: heavy-metal-associated domain-containing protein [Alphaproteobacteria bacterium]|nr:heavy-metal-associated domain-containing protein [Alphaproteobacteria bacterium]
MNTHVLKLKLRVVLLTTFVLLTMFKADSKTNKTDTFKVYGNCGMCKKNIESSLHIKGVQKAHWNKDTKIMTVTFNPKIISLEDIHKKIASIGYDTEIETANDSSYYKLHGCCKYQRKNN